MKISFPTNDRITIAERTGRAKEFVIYDIRDRQIMNIDYRKNTHQHHEHGQEHNHQNGKNGHSHQEIIDLLGDVDLLIVLRVGKFLKNDFEVHKVSYQITKNVAIEYNLKEYLINL